jgi:hypothetical protein
MQNRKLKTQNESHRTSRSIRCIRSFAEFELGWSKSIVAVFILHFASSVLHFAFP